jgi:hypothetical protein
VIGAGEIAFAIGIVGAQMMKREMTPLEITEWLLRQPPPYTKGMIVNRPAGGMSHAGRLFQARMWRRYAMDWGLPDWNLRRQWIEFIGRSSRSECLRRARVNLYLAKRLRRGGYHHVPV